MEDCNGTNKKAERCKGGGGVMSNKRSIEPNSDGCIFGLVFVLMAALGVYSGVYSIIELIVSKCG